MERQNRLAVFEHVEQKERSTSSRNLNTRYSKRGRSPETTFEDNSGTTKKRRKGIYTKKESLVLNCEFGECSYSTNKYYDLIYHVENHAKDNESKKCFWTFCNFTSADTHSLIQHLTFHAYHVKLKNVGSYVLTKLNLPECKQMHDFKIPTQPLFYYCDWKDCDTKIRDFQVFLDHVKCHVNGCNKTNEQVYQCEWIGCSSIYPVQYKLSEHTKCHTKEKLVACPTCETMFSCMTKFYDHRKRQLELDLQGYQCSQCTKLFASERLLRDHMRIHINHYKCHLCDMTCVKPSGLAKHIRYRHLRDKVFQCNICDHRAVTKTDLEIHKIKHERKNIFECLQCNYKCKSKFSYRKHIQNVHEDAWENKYACHCCEEKFDRGASLSKHLMKEHGFHLPSGHSRFLYKQNPKTGLLNLQVVRYESVEVTQEMMQGNNTSLLENAFNSKYECTKVEGKPYAYVLKYVGEEKEDEYEENSNYSEPNQSEEVETSKQDEQEQKPMPKTRKQSERIKKESKKVEKKPERHLNRIRANKKSYEVTEELNSEEEDDNLRIDEEDEVSQSTQMTEEDSHDKKLENDFASEQSKYLASKLDSLTCDREYDEIYNKEESDWENSDNNEKAETNEVKFDSVSNSNIRIIENWSDNEDSDRNNHVIISIGEVDSSGNIVHIEQAEVGQILQVADISDFECELIE